MGFFGEGDAIFFTNEKDPWMPFKPGTKEDYSNLAVALVAVLVEKMSGETFPEFCKKHIFDKVGMPNTSWQFDNLDNVAFPYSRKNNKFTTGGPYCFIDYPNGGLFSTAADFSKFASSMARFGALTNGARLYSKNVGKQAFSCQDLKFKANPSCSWGLGWALEKNQGGGNPLHQMFPKFYDDIGFDGKVPYHDGGEHGYSSLVVLSPNHGLSFGVFANSDIDISQDMGFGMIKAFRDASDEVRCKDFSYSRRICRANGCKFNYRRRRKVRCFG